MTNDSFDSDQCRKQTINILNDNERKEGELLVNNNSNSSSSNNNNDLHDSYSNCIQYHKLNQACVQIFIINKNQRKKRKKCFKKTHRNEK